MVKINRRVQFLRKAANLRKFLLLPDEGVSSGSSMRFAAGSAGGNQRKQLADILLAKGNLRAV